MNQLIILFIFVALIKQKGLTNLNLYLMKDYKITEI